MQVILLEKVHNLGNLGDLVKVKPGHGRNYLIPYGKAVPATEKNILKFEARRAELEQAAAKALAAAKIRADALGNLVVEIRAKAGEEGRLFGSVSARDISEAITAAAGSEISKSEIQLPNGVIRQVGQYEIFVQIHTDIRVAVQVNVVPE
jgi:large subunit ribosomal protein L9